MKGRNSKIPAIYLIIILSTGILLFGFQNGSIKPFSTPAAKYTQPNIKGKVLLNVPVYSQFPELPRGCEVTSLSMLLQSAGVSAQKLTLAHQLKKTAETIKTKDGKTVYGNPNLGFVGNMFTLSQPGYAVYAKPVFDLGEKYLPGRMVNLTGASFDRVKLALSENKPVWTIVNTEYRRLPESYFQKWTTQAGPVRVTKKEHAVVITGYDANYVYFNDPLTGKKNKKAPYADFVAGWKQMGSQALTYSDKKMIAKNPLADWRWS
ncbi:C39 family peptidase [Heyndrickxia acidicola]|uniref:C39 family peptidase n=1 Tax=Heyndrickxia acidicola TaxID=209389 RepID=A0ABU6MIQ3_9BACI|nr:C39 family peptidase [Heyndrickxia acidicola]MED1203117.1 C39 family peptidase [Heyndrickxia acidicola]